MATGLKLNKTFRDFIERQKLFFVATAGIDGSVNLSPKGMNTLRVLSDNRIVWLNLTGSGNETAAHLRSVNRMTLMFCAFESDARILRVYGTADVLHPHDNGWAEAIADFPEIAGSRQIFDLTIDRVQTSCGTGVPFMEFKGDRADTELVPFYENMGPDGVIEYWRKKNSISLDGEPTGIFGPETDHG